MKLKRIHYLGGLSQDRFFENGGGRRKPTLLRVKALLGDEAAVQPRTFGLILEANIANDAEFVPTPATPPTLTILSGGKKES